MSRNRVFHRLRVILCPLLLAMSLLVSVDLTAEEERQELVEERQIFSKTFLHDDDSRTLHLGVEPLHFQPPGADGLEVIDPTLVREDGWVNFTNSFPIRLPEVLGDGEPVELGPELGVRWRPGMLRARLHSGAVVDLGNAQPSWGAPSEEHPNAVLYPDLYPGLDLLAQVRRGALSLEMQLSQWNFAVTPEQVETFLLEAHLEIPGSLLQAVEERASQGGEGFDEIPLYLGEATEEFLISVVSDPGIADQQLLDHSAALVLEDGQEPAPAPAEWRSDLQNWLDSGTVEHAFRLAPEASGVPSVGAGSAALTAAFELTARQTLESSRFFAPNLRRGKAAGPGTTGVLTFWWRHAFPGGTGTWGTRLVAGRGDGYIFRVLMGFEGMRQLKQELDALPSWEIVEVAVGYAQTYGVPPGSVAAAPENVVAYQLLPYVDQQVEKIDAPWIDLVKVPYSAVDLTVPGGSMTLSTWDSRAASGARTASVDGQGYFFGPLANTRGGGGGVPVAISDLETVLQRGMPRFPMVLAMAHDLDPCVPCTDQHPDPAVQALNGDYRVGAYFSDVRLEVRIRDSVAGNGNLAVTSVGGHDDRLYPGETLEWDIELTSLGGGAGAVELTELPWPVENGVDFSFHDPSTGAGLADPILAAVGESVRVRAHWRRADPSLYGTTRDLEIRGAFPTLRRSLAGSVKIPIELRAPEGAPAVTQMQASFSDASSNWEWLATVDLPASGARATYGTQPRLRLVSGPQGQLIENQHYLFTPPLAAPGSDTALALFPGALQPGAYTVEVIPCLKPDGYPADLSCPAPQQVQFTVTADSGQLQPQVDLVDPWSLDDTTNGSTTLSLYGLNLGSAASGTTVTVPQLLSNALVDTGPSGTRVNVTRTVNASGLCGPLQGTVTTTTGSDDFLLNITRAFQGDPHHLVMEAEAGELQGLSAQSFSGASNAQVVGISNPGAPGELKVRFRVPSTSSSYQLYAVYGTPELNASRADVTVREGGTTVVNYKIALSMVPSGQLTLGSLYDATQSAPPTLLNLEAGKTYELVIASRPGQRFPLLDLLILSDGSQPPTLAELCL
ncbi:MAG: hypothetical protein SX243_14565 [Acidobacteriota bacterium]|nr:hypothetical protein [Acidobacteriota bacterium]